MVLFEWASLQATCFLDKGETFQNETLSCTDHLESVVRLQRVELRRNYNGNFVVIKSEVTCLCTFLINEESVILCTITTIKQSGSYPPVYSLTRI